MISAVCCLWKIPGFYCDKKKYCLLAFYDMYICLCAMLHLCVDVLICVCVCIYNILLSSVSIVSVVENCPVCITCCINKVVVLDATQISLLL